VEEEIRAAISDERNVSGTSGRYKQAEIKPTIITNGKR
jgi:hypothetical protein|tara:strand:- start:231 stop:344 length:114 start_codon:yes stop_codon:yes gene_type:complete